MSSLYYDTLYMLVYMLISEARVGQGGSVEFELHVLGTSTQRPGVILSVIF